MTGMGPFFAFFEAVRFAIEQCRLEWSKIRKYRRNQ
jgi:hypothetical protein